MLPLSSLLCFLLSSHLCFNIIVSHSCARKIFKRQFDVVFPFSTPNNHSRFPFPFPIFEFPPHYRATLKYVSLLLSPSCYISSFLSLSACPKIWITMRLAWDFGLASKPSLSICFLPLLLFDSLRFSIGNLQTVRTGRSCLVSNYALQPKHLTKELASSLRLVNVHWNQKFLEIISIWGVRKKFQSY